MEFLIIIILFTSIWVYTDAKKIGAGGFNANSFTGMSPIGWFLACLLLWIVVFPLYLIKRNDIMQNNEFMETALNTKECPKCAERIKDNAKVCRFCGNEFEVIAISKSRDEFEL